ncbi:hypothetical protein BTO02_10955 [Paraburkholderia sp. SOS3]|nr:hypothetical protein BTO02_10955 [Paraburkholderia sp. SOS3]
MSEAKFSTIGRIFILFHWIISYKTLPVISFQLFEKSSDIRLFTLIAEFMRATERIEFGR